MQQFRSWRVLDIVLPIFFALIFVDVRLTTRERGAKIRQKLPRQTKAANLIPHMGKPSMPTCAALALAAQPCHIARWNVAGERYSTTVLTLATPTRTADVPESNSQIQELRDDKTTDRSVAACNLREKAYFRARTIRVRLVGVGRNLLQSNQVLIALSPPTGFYNLIPRIRIG
jgi:hypothetical protein